ncbi:hypothetical protein HY570_00670 [Candidatus Micrarchaeota archaeon]|nr:hypothetical protein [Candidatus Micrarchaeota archaeon]
MNLKLVVFSILILSFITSAHGPEPETAEICGTLPAGKEESITLIGLILYLSIILLGAALAIYGYKYSSSTKWKKDIIALGLVLIISVVAAYLLGPGLNPETLSFGNAGSQHVHADLRVVLDGQTLNLSQGKYMSTSSNIRSSFVHLHNYHGNIIHVHASGVTLGYFLKSINLELSNDCFKTDENQLYCNNGTKSLAVYVNGKVENNPRNYVIKDLDRILIYYGEASKIKQELSMVSNESCIQSRNCIPPIDIEPEEECIT